MNDKPLVGVERAKALRELSGWAGSTQHGGIYIHWGDRGSYVLLMEEAHHMYVGESGVARRKAATGASQPVNGRSCGS